MKQSEIFLEGEGDEWHLRNFLAMRNDSLIKALRSLPLHIRFKSVLEFGCGTGWRLEEIRQEYGCKCFGIDPSEVAINVGEKTYPELTLDVGTATDYPLYAQYDLVVFGFCLYLVDREDLFYIVQKADKLLIDGGYLAIHDFDPESPQVVPYHHKPGVYSYKMDHAKLWLANPAYEPILKVRITDEESITILRKKGWEQFK